MKKIEYTPRVSAIAVLLIWLSGFIANTSLIVLMCIYCFKAESTAFFIVLGIAEIVLIATGITILKEIRHENN